MRPTRRGIGLLIAAVTLYAAAVVTGYAQLAVLAVAAGLAVAAAVPALLERPALQVRRELAPPRAARGEPALAVVIVVAARTTAPTLATDRIGDDTRTLALPAIPRGTAYTTTFGLSTGRRGEVVAGPMTITRTDPLGLLRRTWAYGSQTTLLVVPRTIIVAGNDSGRTSTVDGRSARSSPRGTVSFHGLREYAFGDDLRHIHWRTSARTATLMVRQHVDESLPQAYLLLDACPENYPSVDDAELAVDVAASLALAALRAGFPVRVGTAAAEIFAGQGVVQADALLETLARLGPTPGEGLTGAVSAARPGTGGGSLTVITTAAASPGFSRLAAARAYFDEVVLVRIGRDLEPTQPTSYLTVIDVAALADLRGNARRPGVRA